MYRVVRFTAAAVAGLLASGFFVLSAQAGGFNHVSASAQITTIGGTNTLRVKHLESSSSSATISNYGSSAHGNGFSSTITTTTNGAFAVTNKRSVQRGSAYANNHFAGATGLSASAVKVQSSDGSYFVYKGYVATGVGLTPNGSEAAIGGYSQSASGNN